MKVALDFNLAGFQDCAAPRKYAIPAPHTRIFCKLPALIWADPVDDFENILTNPGRSYRTPAARTLPQQRHVDYRFHATCYFFQRRQSSLSLIDFLCASVSLW